MKSLGRHILVEFHDCSSEVLNDVPRIESSMVNAAKESGATIISSVFHHFSPFGVSGVVVIQESHLAIHTWPEYRYAAVDLFTCGDSVNPWTSYKLLKSAFQAEHGSAVEINRGQLDLLEKASMDIGELRDEAAQQSVVPKYSRSVWFTDRNENMALSIRHRGDCLFREKSPYQTVEVFDTFEYGKLLAVDKMVMCSEKDEKGYHEMIVHVPMVLQPQVKDVLVIGGGDGGSIREILRYDQVERVTMVEIDEAVIRASKEFLPSLSSAFDHPKLKLIIDDGIDYVKRSADECFDMIVVDSSDPVGPAEGLFSADFYRDVYRCLRPGGVMTAQSESPHFNQKAFVELNHCLKEIFDANSVFCYLAFIPTYPTGMWSFTYCTKGGSHPVRDLDRLRAQQIAEGFNLQYYNSDIHGAAFCLPTFIHTMLED
ncbi:MAG: polyamine aminopropyltransferase [Cyanobacteria bacterium P01_H01_bin.26]